MSKFFIGRPIVAIVISILTLMLGSITLSRLAVEQYPFLSPPNIRVTGTYPGASAEAVEQSVATPVEHPARGPLAVRARAFAARNTPPSSPISTV